MNIPNEEDWLNWPAGADHPLDLDEDYARRRFAGKSFEEALELFKTTNVISCWEDVSSMPRQQRGVTSSEQQRGVRSWILL